MVEGVHTLYQIITVVQDLGYQILEIVEDLLQMVQEVVDFHLLDIVVDHPIVVEVVATLAEVAPVVALVVEELLVLVVVVDLLEETINLILNSKFCLVSI